MLQPFIEIVSGMQHIITDSRFMKLNMYWNTLIWNLKLKI